MPRSRTIRFAAGSPKAPFSDIWRLVVTKRDVYLGASKEFMSVVKISLHESGIWTLAGTAESGAVFERGNRRAKQWSRPLQHVKGVTRGPSIFVPHTSLGTRLLPPSALTKPVVWYDGPGVGETVEFSLYFVESGTAMIWNDGEVVLAEAPLQNSHLVLLGSKAPSPPDFIATVEKMLSDNVFEMANPKHFQGGSFLWITESANALKVPIIVDLPVPIRVTPLSR